MTAWKQIFAAAVVAAVPAMAQQAPPGFDLQAEMAKAQGELARAEAELARAGISLPALPALPALASLGLPAQMFFQGRGAGGRFDGDYDRGTRALDEHKYDEAVRRFDAVIDGKSPRADGALYWKAYALNRLGRRDDALAALAGLHRDFPNSHWLNDAQALEAELKQGSGQAVSPAQETNEDLKLMAINSLMSADPDRAMPLLEELLKGNSTPKVKDRALFVLTQNQTPRAQQILAQYAKGAGNPDLQIKAIRYIGMSGTTAAQTQLVNVYGASTDTAMKKEIIRALIASNARDTLFNLAKNEKDEDLRREAIRQLSVIGASDQLLQLYGSEASADNKALIARSLAMSRSTSAETLSRLYTSEADPKAKRAVIEGLFVRGDAKALVDMARRETDAAMKKYIVERLASMHSKEATDYMMELLK